MEKSVFTQHYAALREKIRTMRKAAGITQRELASRLKTVQTVVARMEQGQRRMDMIEFYWVCRALKNDPKKKANEVFDECLALDNPSHKAKRPKRR